MANLVRRLRAVVANTPREVSLEVVFIVRVAAFRHTVAERMPVFSCFQGFRASRNGHCKIVER
jgi:hypothetical protein